MRGSGMGDEEQVAQRFGGEFGGKRDDCTTGVDLGTFKKLVWTSNIGGLMLVAIALELFITGHWIWATVSLIGGIIIALFPSNYEIVGMKEPASKPADDADGAPKGAE